MWAGLDSGSPVLPALPGASVGLSRGSTPSSVSIHAATPICSLHAPQTAAELCSWTRLSILLAAGCVSVAGVVLLFWCDGVNSSHKLGYVKPLARIKSSHPTKNRLWGGSSGFCQIGESAAGAQCCRGDENAQLHPGAGSGRATVGMGSWWRPGRQRVPHEPGNGGIPLPRRWPSCPGAEAAARECLCRAGARSGWAYLLHRPKGRDVHDFTQWAEELPGVLRPSGQKKTVRRRFQCGQLRNQVKFRIPQGSYCGQSRRC